MRRGGDHGSGRNGEVARRPERGTRVRAQLRRGDDSGEAGEEMSMMKSG